MACTRPSGGDGRAAHRVEDLQHHITHHTPSLHTDRADLVPDCINVASQHGRARRALPTGGEGGADACPYGRITHMYAYTHGMQTWRMASPSDEAQEYPQAARC